MSTAKPKNPNRGYLAPNKKNHDRQPDWRGKASVNGQDFLVSGWEKDVTNDKGETARIISFEFTDPNSLPARPAAGAPASSGSAPASSPAASPAAAPASQQGGGQQAGGGAFDDIFSGSGAF